MKRSLLVAALIALVSPAFAQAPISLCTPLFNSSTGALSCIPVGQTSPNITAPNPLPVGGIANAAAPTFTEARAGYLSFDLSGNLRVSATFTPSGTQDVNLTQILGAAPSLTNPLWVFPATGATFPVSGTVTAAQATAASLNATVVGTGTFAVQATLSAETTKVIGTVNQGTSPWVISGAVTNAGTFATQSAITAASGSFASGAFASGSFASGSHASGSFASGSYASGSLASGAMVDLVALSAPVAPATATATKSALIGCQATSAGITPTTGQQAAIDCDLNNNVLTSPGGSPNYVTSQVSVATSDTSVAAARALRRQIRITNVTGTQQVWCSGTTAAANTAELIPAVVGASLTVSTTSAVRCIASTGAQTVTVAEIY